MSWNFTEHLVCIVHDQHMNPQAKTISILYEKINLLQPNQINDKTSVPSALQSHKQLFLFLSVSACLALLFCFGFLLQRSGSPCICLVWVSCVCLLFDLSRTLPEVSSSPFGYFRVWRSFQQIFFHHSFAEHSCFVHICIIIISLVLCRS